MFAGSYGKLLGGAGAGPASMSGHRYSPYPLPSAAGGAGHQHGSQLGAAGAAAGAAAGGVQYTVASPLMSQLSRTPLSQWMLWTGPLWPVRDLMQVSLFLWYR